MEPNNIPSELRQLKRWIVWKYVTDANGEKRKTPFQVNGQMAKAGQPETWSDFDAALAVAHRYEGVGFEFHTGDGFVGVDLDGCRNPKTGEITKWAKNAILAIGSYAEVSPSQTGVKIYAKGKSPYATGRNVKLDLPAADNAGKAPAIEVYDHGRFFCVTGLRLKGMSTLNERTAQIAEVCERLIPKPKASGSASWCSDSEVVERARKYIARIPGAVSGNGGHNVTFHVACVLVHGFGLSKDSAYQCLQEWNATCEPPWSERELQHKIKSADNAQGERNYLRDAEPDTWDAVDVPDYIPVQAKPSNAVRITTLKDAALEYIAKLEDGRETLIPLGLGAVDDAFGGGVEPGELVIFAARPSHGKSAVALQIVHTWTAIGHKAAFVSEEMSSLALGKRAVQYASETPMEHWFHRSKTVRDEVDQHFAKRKDCLIVEGCRTANEAAKQIRRMHGEHGIVGAIVDYAQLLVGRGKTRYEQVTDVSITLRQLANDLKIPLIVLAQLNRDIETRDNKFTPRLSDLRESGQIEQDADVIVFLVWPYKQDASRDMNEYQFFFGKNRNRGISQHVVQVRFEPSRQQILPALFKRVAAFDKWNGKPETANDKDDF